MQNEPSPNSSPRHTRNPVAVALYLNAGLLAAILLVMVSRDNVSFLPRAMAQQAPIGGGAGVFVVPAQFSTNTWGAYLMDVDAQTLVAYQYYPADGLLKMIAARNFRYDRQLSNFNTSLSPNEIRDLVEREKDAGRVLQNGKKPSSPETPPKE